MKNFILKSVLITFFFSCLGPLPDVHAQSMINLPAPGHMVSPSQSFKPLELKGIQIYQNNPLRFDFLVDKGQTGLTGQELKDEITKVTKYFLTCLTVPEKDLWVNLSPFEKDRIAPESFGVTEMGKNLLEQDYLLKQIMASMSYPENELGQQFWQKVYKRAQDLYGTTNLPVSTFNKVWITPKSAKVYVKGNGAFVVDGDLDVMLEADYKAATNHQQASGPSEYAGAYSQVIREVILPQLREEINHGKNFAVVRQVYHSMILATWYKRHLKDTLLSKVYVGQNKVTGVDVEDKDVKEKIFQQYLKAYKKCVYNYIRDDYDPITQTTVARKYASGGMDFALFGLKGNDYAELTSSEGISLGNDLAMATVDVAATASNGQIIRFPDARTFENTHPFKQVSHEAEELVSDRSALSSQMRAFLPKLTLTVMLAVAGLNIAQPSAQAAVYTPGTNSTVILTVQKGDTPSTIIQDMRMAFAKANPAQYRQSPYAGALWGTNGAIHKVLGANANHLTPGQRVTLLQAYPVEAIKFLSHTGMTVSPSIAPTKLNTPLPSVGKRPVNKVNNGGIPPPSGQKTINKSNNTPQPGISQKPVAPHVNTPGITPQSMMRNQTASKASFITGITLAVVGFSGAILAGYLWFKTKPKQRNVFATSGAGLTGPMTLKKNPSSGGGIGNKLRGDLYISKEHSPEDPLMPTVKEEEAAKKAVDPAFAKAEEERLKAEIAALPRIVKRGKLGWMDPFTAISGMSLAVVAFGLNPIALGITAALLPFVRRILLGFNMIPIHEVAGHARAAAKLHGPAVNAYRAANLFGNYNLSQLATLFLNPWKEIDQNSYVALPVNDTRVQQAGITTTRRVGIVTSIAILGVGLSHSWALILLGPWIYAFVKTLRGALKSDRSRLPQDQNGDYKYECAIGGLIEYGTPEELAHKDHTVGIQWLQDVSINYNRRGILSQGILAQTLTNLNGLTRSLIIIFHNRWPTWNPPSPGSPHPHPGQRPPSVRYGFRKLGTESTLVKGDKPKRFGSINKKLFGKIQKKVVAAMAAVSLTQAPPADVQNAPLQLHPYLHYEHDITTNEITDQPEINTPIIHNGDGKSYDPLNNSMYDFLPNDIRYLSAPISVGEMRDLIVALTDFEGPLPSGDSPPIGPWIDFNQTGGDWTRAAVFSHVKVHHKTAKEIREDILNRQERDAMGELVNPEYLKFAGPLSRPDLDDPEKTLKDSYIPHRLKDANLVFQKQYQLMQDFKEALFQMFLREVREKAAGRPSTLPDKVFAHWYQGGQINESRMRAYIDLMVYKYFTGDLRQATKEFRLSTTGTHGVAVTSPGEPNNLELIGNNQDVILGINRQIKRFAFGSHPNALQKPDANGNRLDTFIYLNRQGKGEIASVRINTAGELEYEIFVVDENRYLTPAEKKRREFKLVPGSPFFRDMPVYQNEDNMAAEEMNAVPAALVAANIILDDPNSFMSKANQRALESAIEIEIEDRLFGSLAYQKVYPEVHERLLKLIEECQPIDACSEDAHTFLLEESLNQQSSKSILMRILRKEIIEAIPVIAARKPANGWGKKEIEREINELIALKKEEFIGFNSSQVLPRHINIDVFRQELKHQHPQNNLILQKLSIQRNQQGAFANPEAITPENLAAVINELIDTPDFYMMIQINHIRNVLPAEFGSLLTAAEGGTILQREQYQSLNRAIFQVLYPTEIQDFRGFLSKKHLSEIATQWKEVKKNLPATELTDKQRKYRGVIAGYGSANHVSKLAARVFNLLIPGLGMEGLEANEMVNYPKLAGDPMDLKLAFVTETALSQAAQVAAKNLIDAAGKRRVTAYTPRIDSPLAVVDMGQSLFYDPDDPSQTAVADGSVAPYSNDYRSEAPVINETLLEYNLIRTAIHMAQGLQKAFPDQNPLNVRLNSQDDDWLKNVLPQILLEDAKNAVGHDERNREITTEVVQSTDNGTETKARVHDLIEQRQDLLAARLRTSLAVNKGISWPYVIGSSIAKGGLLTLGLMGINALLAMKGIHYAIPMDNWVVRAGEAMTTIFAITFGFETLYLRYKLKWKAWDSKSSPEQISFLGMKETAPLKCFFYDVLKSMAFKSMKTGSRSGDYTTSGFWELYPNASGRGSILDFHIPPDMLPLRDNLDSTARQLQVSRTEAIILTSLKSGAHAITTSRLVVSGSQLPKGSVLLESGLTKNNIVIGGGQFIPGAGHTVAIQDLYAIMDELGGTLVQKAVWSGVFERLSMKGKLFPARTHSGALDHSTQSPQAPLELTPSQTRHDRALLASFKTPTVAPVVAPLVRKGGIDMDSQFMDLKVSGDSDMAQLVTMEGKELEHISISALEPKVSKIVDVSPTMMQAMLVGN